MRVGRRLRAMTLAATASPRRSARISSMLCTTCAPSYLTVARNQNAEPVSLKLTSPLAPTSRPVALITTTDELACERVTEVLGVRCDRPEHNVNPATYSTSTSRIHGLPSSHAMTSSLVESALSWSWFHRTRRSARLSFFARGNALAELVSFASQLGITPGSGPTRPGR